MTRTVSEVVPRLGALRLIGMLLAYPDGQRRGALPALAAGLAGHTTLRPVERVRLADFARSLAALESDVAGDRYAGLFERTRALSLDLFEHAFAGARPRAEALLALGERYRLAGFEPDTRDLPDHLPLFLEFLSLLPSAEALSMLKAAAPALEKIRVGLDRRDSGYAAVFDVLLAIAATAPRSADAASDTDDDVIAADHQWGDAAALREDGEEARAA